MPNIEFLKHFLLVALRFCRSIKLRFIYSLWKNNNTVLTLYREMIKRICVVQKKGKDFYWFFSHILRIERKQKKKKYLIGFMNPRLVKKMRGFFSRSRTPIKLWILGCFKKGRKISLLLLIEASSIFQKSHNKHLV